MIEVQVHRVAHVKAKLMGRAFRLLLRAKRLLAQTRVYRQPAAGATTATRMITFKAPKR